MAIYSGFSHWKWWFSIVCCMFTRGYQSPFFPSKEHIPRRSSCSCSSLLESPLIVTSEILKHTREIDPVYPLEGLLFTSNSRTLSFGVFKKDDWVPSFFVLAFLVYRSHEPNQLLLGSFNLSIFQCPTIPSPFTQSIEVPKNRSYRWLNHGETLTLANLYCIYILCYILYI